MRSLYADAHVTVNHIKIPSVAQRCFYGELFFPVPPNVHIEFVVLPPGCGRSLTYFWGWGAFRAQLRCPDDVSDDIYIYIYKRGVPGGALNLNFAGYPDHGRYEELSLQGKQNRKSNPGSHG
jgi:hypothetical protein